MWAEWQLGHLSGLLAPTELIVVTVEETQCCQLSERGSRVFLSGSFSMHLLMRQRLCYKQLHIFGWLEVCEM